METLTAAEFLLRVKYEITSGARLSSVKSLIELKRGTFAAVGFPLFAFARKALASIV